MSLEQEKSPAFDGIVVLGRGIEEVETSSGEKWRPTRAVEKMSDDKQHSGKREKNILPQSEDESVVVAGANANVIAATELFEKLQKKGTAPALVIFSAGRPAYLENDPDPDLSEGKILEQKFARKIGLGAKGVKPETIVLDKNKNTKDDIVSALEIARGKNIKQLAIITIGLHIERAREFYTLAIQDNPPLQDIAVEFIPSEKLLEERYFKSPSASKMLARELESLQESAAWKRTEEREKRGVEKLRDGTYNQKSQGYGFIK